MPGLVRNFSEISSFPALFEKLRKSAVGWLPLRSPITIRETIELMVYSPPDLWHSHHDRTFRGYLLDNHHWSQLPFLPSGRWPVLGGGSAHSPVRVHRSPCLAARAPGHRHVQDSCLGGISDASSNGHILPLFTLLEDLGYLPRVAFNLDNFSRKPVPTESRLSPCAWVSAAMRRVLWAAG